MSIAGAERATEREAMVAEIERITEGLAGDLGDYALDERVLAAMRSIPRHEFVPADQAASAYRNRPLPIGHRQTISQPFIVALMTSLLKLGPEDRVLEVGTGSGYQAAVLSRIAGQVYSVEIVDELARQAAADLARLGYANVTTRTGDGYQGWPEEAPFDAIIVTAAPSHIPEPLIAQLKPGGRMVLPVGQEQQDLLLVEKQGDGRTVSSSIIPVRFVPLVHGRPE